MQTLHLPSMTFEVRFFFPKSWNLGSLQDRKWWKKRLYRIKNVRKNLQCRDASWAIFQVFCCSFCIVTCSSPYLSFYSWYEESSATDSIAPWKRVISVCISSSTWFRVHIHVYIFHWPANEGHQKSWRKWLCFINLVVHSMCKCHLWNACAFLLLWVSWGSLIWYVCCSKCCACWSKHANCAHVHPARIVGYCISILARSWSWIVSVVGSKNCSLKTVFTSL